VWLSLSIYSFTGREVTSATVAALLTILGYSLYDVVIVFDRIRENTPIMRRSTYREVVNTSVHETLTRSLITMLTTLIPLTVLYFFGGDTLKDFAFALLVGILSGGLSSIAIAAPLAALWKEREPEAKRRATKIERRRAVAIATDSDVVDNAALARAEAALDAELRAEAGLSGAHPEEEEYVEYEDEEPAQLEAGDEEPEAVADEEPEPPGDEPEPEPVAHADATDGDDVPVDGDDGTDEDAQEVEPAGAKEPGNGSQRARPDPNRQRRHRQVQRKRRK
jgi:SecD/SecF fusion protein